jgi:riboflavin biosynthesis pyrimidine reductase
MSTPILRRLLPFPSGGAASVGVPQILDELACERRRREQAEPGRARPTVLLNMASTADGRASVDGRAGPIGDRADSELLHGLRTLVDGLLVGAGTVRVEGYARLLRGEDDRRSRRERGLAEELPMFIVSASLDVTPQNAPMLAEPRAEVTILTPSAGLLGPCAAKVRYVRCERDGKLDLAAALRRMRSELGVRTLLCEGGPHLAAELIRARLVDDLFLSLAPKLAGGEEHLRILAGGELDPPLSLQLVEVHEHDCSVFLRYRLGG